MISGMAPLQSTQKEIMSEFYSIRPSKVLLTKQKRNNLWKAAVAHRTLDFDGLKRISPALEHQIRKAYSENGRNIQPAVFSECIYAQTYANMLGLNLFVNCIETPDFIPDSVSRLLKSYSLVPRYVYLAPDRRRMLVQAGGCGGIDCALISVPNSKVLTIEFKEPYAKTSEPDLPKYGEDGKLILTDDFNRRYPQFRSMMEEHIGLRFFEVMGNNIRDFSAESINIAVSNNYTKKFADVICTEDTKGVLTMVPSNHAASWAATEGEIRPAGRNHYNVWTPGALRNFLGKMGATMSGNVVAIRKSCLNERRARCGGGTVTGYKINPLFFVYIKDCRVQGDIVQFDISAVQQLNPTIAAKVDFRKTLKYDEVARYYRTLLGMV